MTQSPGSGANMVLHRCNELVDRTIRFPARVLRAPLRAAGFLEFDLALDWSWPLFSRLSSLCEDEWVNVITLEPDPVDYYFTRFHLLPIARIPLTASESEYLQLLESIPDPGGDSIKIASSEILWFSDSGQWAVWGDRDHELALLAVTDQFREMAENAVKQHRSEKYHLRIIPPRKAVETWVYSPQPGLIDSLEASYPEAIVDWESLPPVAESI